MRPQALASTFDANLLDQASTKLAEIDTLLPVRPALTAKQRQCVVVLGDKSMAFVSQAIELCTANPDILPRGIDLGGILEKYTAHDNLLRLEARMGQSLETARDIRMQIGNDLLNTALAVYALSGRPFLGAGLKTGRAALERRFKKGKGSSPAGNPTPAPGA